MQETLLNSRYELERKWQELVIWFHSGILLSLFDPEDGGDIFPRNIG
jgi:hypothetical protein